MQAQQKTQANAAGPIWAQRQSFNNAGSHHSVLERTERTSKPWTLLSSAVVRQMLRDLMSNTFRYDKTYESELIALLKKDPEWNSFTHDGAIDVFKRALLSNQTYICKSQGEVCGYLRALVDGFGIYVSELYVAPAFRNNGYGKGLLKEINQDHPDRVVYVLSDEDLYYEKLGYKRVGSVFQL